MISIIIPLYNKELYIKDTIESIISQNYKDFEIVIVNDGSKDNSLSVIESISDNRIRIVNKENEGVSKTRNRGIKEAKGEWIMFFDADDLMVEGCLQALVDLGNQFPDANILCGNFITRTEHQDFNSSVIKENCLISNPYELIWKKKWNLRLGSFIAKKNIAPYFVDNMAKGEDVLYCFDMLVNCKVAYTPCNTMIYVIENSNLSLKLLPLDRTLSWAVCLDNKNTYLKSIYVDILIKAIIIYTSRYKKPGYSMQLLIRHFKSLFLYTPLYIYRKLFCK